MVVDTSLPVRRIAFEYPDDLDPAWISGRPEFACAANSVSLLMPYAEPYFVHSVRAALPDLDGDLEERTRDYLAQEQSHFAQHQKFNTILRRHHPRVERLEHWMKRCCDWLARTRSRRFNLAFAAGSETIAFAIARWTESRAQELFLGAEPVPTTLFMWHLAEEVEHKTAAFDAYEAVDGSRLRYAFAMTMSMILLGWFTFVGTLMMLFAEGRGWNPLSYVRLLTLSISLAFVLLPTMLVSAMPGHHPSDLSDPVFLPAWLGQYDPATRTVPLWETDAPPPG
jgi:predicted metal-dependent hydrolase